MPRTQYDIHTKEIYTREYIEFIITTQCEKRHYPVPDFSHGYLSKVASSIGVEPLRRQGRSYCYIGRQAIVLINKVLENRSKKKGEPKQRTKTSPSKKPMAKPSQISIDDISRNTKYDQLIDKLMECIGIIESMKEE